MPFVAGRQHESQYPLGLCQNEGHIVTRQKWIPFLTWSTGVSALTGGFIWVSFEQGAHLWTMDLPGKPLDGIWIIGAFLGLPFLLGFGGFVNHSGASEFSLGAVAAGVVSHFAFYAIIVGLIRYGFGANETRAKIQSEAVQSARRPISPAKGCLVVLGGAFAGLLLVIASVGGLYMLVNLTGLVPRDRRGEVEFVAILSALPMGMLGLVAGFSLALRAIRNDSR